MASRSRQGKTLLETVGAPPVAAGNHGTPAVDPMKLLGELIEQRARRARSRYASFDDFWVAYLRAHSNPKVAGFHVLGAALSVTSFVAIAGCGMVFFAAFAIIPAQLFGAIGHWFAAEPDLVSPSRPDWAVVANLRMLWLALRGELDDAVRDATAPQR